MSDVLDRVTLADMVGMSDRSKVALTTHAGVTPMPRRRTAAPGRRGARPRK